MSTPKPIIVSYLRFSTPEQSTGDSRRRQLQLSERWAKKQGVEIADNLADLGVSAFRGANAATGALASFLQLVDQGKIARGSTLLVESLDRLSRAEALRAVGLFTSILNAGIRIVTLTDGREYTSESVNANPFDLMFSIMVMSRANEESAMKSKRLAAAWVGKRAAMADKPLTTILPAWLKLDGGKIVVDKAKAATVKTIFTLAAEGHGLSVITKRLNKEGEAFGKVGHWNRSYVMKILKGRAVLGEFQPHRITYASGKKRREPVGEPLPNYFPRIIRCQLFYAAQAAMRKRRQVGGPQTKFVNLFAGMLYSVTDASPIRIVNKGESGRRYCSAAALEGRKGAAEPVMFPVSAFEAAMLIRLHDPELFGEKRDGRAAELREQTAAVESEIAELDEKIEAVQGALIGGEARRSASVVAMLNKFDARRAELAAKLGALLAQAADASPAERATVADFFTLLEQHHTGEFSVEQRERLKAVLARHVERIDCHFIREGRDYIAATMVTLRNGEQFDFTFRANHKSMMLRDNYGHPVKRNGPTPPPTYELEIAVAQAA